MSSDLEQDRLWQSFIAWQCRIRKQVMREREGRPASGMCPTVLIGNVTQTQITVLLNPIDAIQVAGQFEFAYKKTQDRAQRQEGAIKILAETYFQDSEQFSDEMTALFAADSLFAKTLLDADNMSLLFKQANQEFKLSCDTRALSPSDPVYQLTYWHNALFNPYLYGTPIILALKPDWATAENAQLY